MTLTVHFFKPSGKWYTTEEIEILFDTWDPILNLKETLKVTLKNRLKGMIAVVTDHPQYPIMLTEW